MMITRALGVGLLAALTVPVAAAATAAPTSSAAAKPPPPRAGYYSVASAFSTGGAGHFRIARRHVKGFAAVAGADETQYCGAATYHVLGRQAVHFATGHGQRMWIVGKGIGVHQSYEVTPVVVSVRHAGATVKGRLRMRFDADAGQLDVPGCTMTFSLRRRHG